MKKSMSFVMFFSLLAVVFLFCAVISSFVLGVFMLLGLDSTLNLLKGVTVFLFSGTLVSMLLSSVMFIVTYAMIIFKDYKNKKKK